jgi:hypothetical protein
LFVTEISRIQTILHPASLATPLGQILSIHPKNDFSDTLLFALVMFGVIELGWYMVRYEALNRAVSTAAEAIVNNCGSFSQTSANSTGSGIIPFGTGDNYICAQAYQNYKSGDTCASGTWALGRATVTCADTGAPCISPYYVALKGNAAAFSLTHFVNEVLPNGHGGNITNIAESVIVTVGSKASSCPLPTCPAGQFLTYNGSTISCAAPTSASGGEWVNTIPSNCGGVGNGNTPLVWCQEVLSSVGSVTTPHQCILPGGAPAITSSAPGTLTYITSCEKFGCNTQWYCNGQMIIGPGADCSPGDDNPQPNNTNARVYCPFE